MDILEELSTPNLVEVLAIGNAISVDLKQHFIDNGMVEYTVKDKKPYYFGKKWTPSGYGWKEGHYITEYKDGKRVYYKNIPFKIITFDNIIYSDLLGYYELWKLVDKRMEVSIFAVGVMTISLKVKETFDGIPLDRVEISEGCLCYEYVDNNYISDDDYLYPSIAYTENPRNFINQGDLKKLEHNNPQVTWGFGDYYPFTEAGYMPKRTRALYIPNTMERVQGELIPIGEIKEQDYQTVKDIKVPDNVTEIIDKILEILPPISAETALYNPGIYIDCMPRIGDLVRMYTS